jgi:hypothetical protein
MGEVLYGAIVLSPDWDFVLLVPGPSSDSWRLPFGKGGSATEPTDKAIDSVARLTGIDVSTYLLGNPLLARPDFTPT